MEAFEGGVCAYAMRVYQKSLLTCLPSQHNYRATIGPPAKRHSNGVLLVGRRWPANTMYMLNG